MIACRSATSKRHKSQSNVGVAMAKEVNTPFSEKKKSRLEALERRLQSPVTPNTSVSNIPTDEDGDPAYVGLCKSIFTSPLATQLQLHGDKASNLIVDDLLRDLLESNVKTIKDVEGTIENKLLGKVVFLENPVSRGGRSGKGGFKSKKRTLSKRSSGHISLQRHRKLGSFTIAEKYQKYELYVELHQLWKDYMKKLLKDCSETMIQSRLLGADLHGAIIGIVDSKVISFIGVQGIMIRETENTFGIITSKDQLKVVPKSGTIFMLQLEDLRVTLIGNNLQSRSLKNDRVKQKSKATIEL